MAALLTSSFRLLSTVHTTYCITVTAVRVLSVVTRMWHYHSSVGLSSLCDTLHVTVTAVRVLSVVTRMWHCHSSVGLSSLCDTPRITVTDVRVLSVVKRMWHCHSSVSLFITVWQLSNPCFVVIWICNYMVTRNIGNYFTHILTKFLLMFFAVRWRKLQKKNWRNTSYLVFYITSHLSKLKLNIMRDETTVLSLCNHISLKLQWTTPGLVQYTSLNLTARYSKYGV